MMNEEDSEDTAQPVSALRQSTRRAGTSSRISSDERKRYTPYVEPYTLAQLSFAPATQTTIVTTTTTTTTQFPPFSVPQPKSIQQLDPKIYPLAASPTPANLRRIAFVVSGKHAEFREANDTGTALQHLRTKQKKLKAAHGTMQTTRRYGPWVETQSSQASGSSSISQHIDGNRPASPESISDTEGLAQVIPHSSLHNGSSEFRSRANLEASTSQTASNPNIQRIRVSNPITPDSQPRMRRDTRRSSQLPLSSNSMLPSPHLEQSISFSATPRALIQQSHDESRFDARQRDYPWSTCATNRGNSNETVVPTPPVESDDNPRRPQSRRALSSVPTRLNVTESPSAHDGSLPSPSLSPVTAAANLQSIGYFADIDSNSEVASQHDFPSASNDAEHNQDHSHSLDQLPQFDQPDGIESESSTSRFSNLAMAEIPAMLDYFEAIPDELKSYVMHQLLRRCPKNTLHMVADAVNPALKCDFLILLPLELGLNILSYLDVKSLCKAAQVSKKWRQMINSDEKCWQELFELDGFSLPEGEMQQAITEGWGWQDPYGAEGYEMNINSDAYAKSETEANGSVPSSPQSSRGMTGLLRRSKRKAATMLCNKNKQLKTRNISYENSTDLTATNLLEHVTKSESPYNAANAANAAILAVPRPQVGLPSLKGLHLYKSLYRRHYLIRKNWMCEDTRPRHIAFRAHDTHVVTCLQFDTDKILTGSDDNNINVYDTKSGALRAKLVGHEGGVWALQYIGNTLVSGSTDRSVRIWDIEGGREKHVFRGHTSTVRCLQIVTPVNVGENAEGKAIMMPKQTMIITGSRDSTLRVWKLPKPEDPSFIQAETDGENDDCPYFVRALTGHQHSVRAIAAYADTLVSGSYDYTVRVWRISTGETVHRLQGHTQKVYSVVLDHTRNRCISGSMDNMVRIWSLDTGSALYTLEGHTSLVGLLDLNCDRLVSAAADSTLRIWDPENGQCKATLSAHTGAITCFQHDGSKVISGSDRTLKLWNIKTGECIKDLLSDLSGVWQVKFNERRCVAAVQRDGLTYIEVLDFGAARDGVPESRRGRRIAVDADGVEINPEENAFPHLEGIAA